MLKNIVKLLADTLTNMEIILTFAKTFRTAVQLYKLCEILMDKIIKEFKYEKNGTLFVIETERYGVCGFDIFVTAEDYGATKVPSYIPFGSADVIMLQDFRYQGKRFGITPPEHIMNSIRQAKSEEIVESKASKERRKKEKEWDDLYNDGSEGYNPYRSPSKPEFREPYYKGDENPE